MTHFDDLRQLPVAWLADQCSIETTKFFQNKDYDAKYCFELLKRACYERDDEALTHVYKIYLPILSHYARRHSAFARSSQDASSFALSALSNFYQAVKAEKFLQKFSTLKDALGYLYTCLHNEILQDIKKHRRDTALDDDPTAPPESSYLALEELWQHICTLLPNSHEQRLAYLRFVLEMKPAEIVVRFPELGSHQRDISIKLFQIRQKLRKDPMLRHLMGFDDDKK